jgi:ubiquitin carboxyl-terminal hydrolase L5
MLSAISSSFAISIILSLGEFTLFRQKFTEVLELDKSFDCEGCIDSTNIYIRKIDMLNEDLHMKNEAAPSKRGRKRSRNDWDEDNSAFHFIAFVPIDGKLWKLDGLDRQPHNLGSKPLQGPFIRLF